jgi:6-phosphogluconolactonase
MHPREQDMAKHVGPARADVVIVETPATLAEEGAELVARAAVESIAARGRFAVALAGGATPRGLYARLAAEPLRSRVDWSRSWIFFGDERCVPPTDPESNYLMAHTTLLGRVAVPPGQIFRMPGEATDPDGAACDYEQALRAVFAPDPVRLDLVLLGLGVDGHVASLFPGSPALEETERLVVAVDVRAAVVSRRITLTLPAVNAARRVLFLVAGGEKARSVAGALRNPTSPLPAARVRPDDGALTWLLDRSAAANLGSAG